MDNLDVQRGQDEADIIRDTVLGITDCLPNEDDIIRDTVLDTHTNHTSPSRFMAPNTLRSLSPTSFTPQVVSIGPLHRNQDNLQAFEVEKANFVGQLLDRPKPIPRREMLEACVQKVAASIVQIRACYPSEEPTDVDLAKMMVMDACFILEFIHRLSETNDHLSDPHIPYDLVLIENQIPFFVLKDIFDCTISKIEKCTLAQYIHPLLKLLNPIQTKIQTGNSDSETPHDHILGLLYHCYKPKWERALYGYSLYPNKHPAIELDPKKRSAIELDQAGVNFKPNNKEASWPMAMNVEMHTSRCFSQSWVRPTLRMPALRINHFTELVLRNLIAYEQYSSALRFISSYAMAMDMLIDTQEDIARLVKSKVIINHLGTNQDAANMINNICKQVSWGTFSYYEQWKQLDSHCNTYWPSKILLLRRTYFSSPWSIIALVTAIGVFLLTLIQTICSLIQTIYTIK
uniref:UPF0481 protein At3g47200-like n=1 Tax=Erigeron canadensis TaxID=72917 RepID=UPI001CB89EB6|nr:UPF0481 protein At3g47200-like [Erigeron canadensis]XP_043606474.1 UPF0481 protein At3g47200-like [Erigeron canadensis]XP_043606475.1 UPF0481 protein At3g47200-like [Erigeron canadensis]